MIAATASCIPHNVHKIPENIGLLALGAIFTSSVAFFYSLIINRNKKSINSGTISILLKKNRYTDFIESENQNVVDYLINKNIFEYAK